MSTLAELPRQPRVCLSLLVAGVLTVTLPAASASAISWPGRSVVLHLASSPRGTVALAWQTNGFTRGGGHTYVVVQTHGGRIEGPWKTRESTLDLDGLAVDDAGDVAVVWEHNDGTGPSDRAGGCCDRVWLAWRPRGGRLRRPVRVSPPGVDAVVRADAAAIRGHRATVIFDDDGYSRRPHRGIWVVRAPVGGRWPAASLIPAADEHLLDAAERADGTALLLLQSSSNVVQRFSLGREASALAPFGATLAAASAATGSLASDGTALVDDRPTVCCDDRDRIALGLPAGPWQEPVPVGSDAAYAGPILAARGGTGFFAYHPNATSTEWFARVRPGELAAFHRSQGSTVDMAPSGDGAVWGQLEGSRFVAGRLAPRGPLNGPHVAVADRAAVSTTAVASLPGKRVALAWTGDRRVFLELRRLGG